jgi:hypothetical protein
MSFARWSGCQDLNTAIVHDPARIAQLLANCPMGDWGNPDDIGVLAVHICSEHGGVFTGADSVTDGGWLAT